MGVGIGRTRDEGSWHESTVLGTKTEQTEAGAGGRVSLPARSDSGRTRLPFTERAAIHNGAGSGMLNASACEQPVLEPQATGGSGYPSTSTRAAFDLLLEQKCPGDAVLRSAEPSQAPNAIGRFIEFQDLLM